MGGFDPVYAILAGVTIVVIVGLLVGIALMLGNNAPVRLGTGRRRTGQTAGAPQAPVAQGPAVAGHW